MARQYYYYKALRKTITQFLDIFNNMKIARYNTDGTFKKLVEVPLKFSPKEKIWFWLNERKDDEMLPMMSVSMTGVEYAIERATNKNFSVSTSCPDDIAGTSNVSRYLAPSPFDISFQLNIWTLYLTDVDQILEQILPWFQPHVVIKIKLEEINTTFDAKVVFRSASPEHESEYSDEGRRVLKYVLDFSVQTLLFKPAELSGVVGKILMNYYTNEETFRTALNDAYTTDSTFTSAASGESQVFTALGYTADDKVIFKYEIFQFGKEIGNDIEGTFDPK